MFGLSNLSKTKRLRGAKFWCLDLCLTYTFSWLMEDPGGFYFTPSQMFFTSLCRMGGLLPPAHLPTVTRKIKMRRMCALWVDNWTPGRATNTREAQGSGSLRWLECMWGWCEIACGVSLSRSRLHEEGLERPLSFHRQKSKQAEKELHHISEKLSHRLEELDQVGL